MPNFAWGCPDIRGRSESGLHLVRELASRVKPVDTELLAADPAAWNAPPWRPSPPTDKSSIMFSWGNASWRATMMDCQEHPAPTSTFRRIMRRGWLATFSSHDSETTRESTILPLPLQTKTAVHTSARNTVVLARHCCTPGPKFTPGPAQLNQCGSVSRPRLSAGAACKPMP